MNFYIVVSSVELSPNPNQAVINLRSCGQMHEILEKDLCGKIFRSRRRRHTAEKGHTQKNHRRWFSDSKRRILINYSKINSRHGGICIFIVYMWYSYGRAAQNHTDVGSLGKVTNSSAKKTRFLDFLTLNMPLFLDSWVVDIRFSVIWQRISGRRRWVFVIFSFDRISFARLVKRFLSRMKINQSHSIHFCSLHFSSPPQNITFIFARFSLFNIEIF